MNSMLQFLNNIRFSANTEILCLLMLGIFFQIADGSPFQIKQKWEAVWSTDLPREYFSPLVQKIIKTVLSAIVVARCGATYPYVVSAMLVFFCMLKDGAPKLMLPWIFVAIIKSVFVTFVEALTGVYVCSAFGKIHKACIEFFISKALEIIFAAYLWGSVLSIYQDMERRLENKKILENAEISYIKQMDFKRQRARSLLDESTLYKTACLNNFEFKDVPQIMLQMLRRADEMSQDSLLGPGMMLASVSNMGSFDYLKRSESLGELEYTNLQSTKVIGLDEEENLSPPEKVSKAEETAVLHCALKFLKMTWSDVRRVQRHSMSLQNDVFAINSDTWFQVSASDAHIYKPKQARTEVFIRELPERELDEDGKTKKRSAKVYDLKLGMSLFNLIKKNEVDNDEDESFTNDEEDTEEERDEKEEDLELSQIFMSNIKEEKPVNRIGLHFTAKPNKGKAYYKLYRKHFMSVIGPEVFDRATKLQKVTSFTIIKPHKENSISLDSNQDTLQPEMLDPKLNEKNYCEVQFSIRDIHKINQNSGDSLAENGIMRISSEDDHEENKPEVNRLEAEIKDNNCHKSDNENIDKSQCLFRRPPPSPEGIKVKKNCPFYRKRKIRIKWIGKLKENDLIECVQTNSSYSHKSDDSSEFHLSGTDRDTNNTKRHHKMKTSPPFLSGPSEKRGNGEKFIQNREIYFLTKLLNKPLPDLSKYYDLKNTTYTRRRRFTISQTELEFTNNLYKMYCLKRFKTMCEFGGKHNKIWKSKVLKTAEVHQQPLTGDFLNIIDEGVVNKLLRYEYLYLMGKKIKENDSNDNLIPSLQVVAEGTKNVDDKEQSSIGSSKSRNKLCCKSHSENLFQGHATFAEDNSNTKKRNFSETPSERSIEVCHKDLTNEEISDCVHGSTSLGDCYTEKGFKTTEDKTEFFEDAEDDSLCSQGSDEPISLYYSQAADLASPLLDMKKFIYPDHIHYSYKHVNKKGFDVNINGDLPLLVQSQALTTNNNLHVKEFSAKPESEITRRPMDLSFAKTNAFAEWQNNEQNVSGPLNEQSEETEKINSRDDIRRTKRGKNNKKKKTHDSDSNSPINEFKGEYSKSLDAHQVYFIQDYDIREKLKKTRNQLSKKEHHTLTYDKDRTPVQISSTQLHSNKGRINSTYSPALRLQENKKEEKKKVETQEKRTKDMLARLEREILFQNKNGFNSNKPL